MLYPIKYIKGYLEVRRIAKTEKTREEQAKKKYGWDRKCRQCNKGHHADEAAFCSAESKDFWHYECECGHINSYWLGTPFVLSADTMGRRDYLIATGKIRQLPDYIGDVDKKRLELERFDNKYLYPFRLQKDRKTVSQSRWNWYGRDLPMKDRLHRANMFYNSLHPAPPEPELTPEQENELRKQSMRDVATITGDFMKDSG